MFRYTHIEAECPFMSFEDLLNRLEDLVCDVVDRVLKSPAAELLYDINPVSHISWDICVCAQTKIFPVWILMNG